MAKLLKRRVPRLQIFSFLIIVAGLFTATKLAQQPQKPNPKAAVSISCSSNSTQVSCSNMRGCAWTTGLCTDLSNSDCANHAECSLQPNLTSCTGLSETTCTNTASCTPNYTLSEWNCSGSPPCANGCTTYTPTASCAGYNENTCKSTLGCTPNYNTLSGTCSGIPPCSPGCSVNDSYTSCTLASGCNQPGCTYDPGYGYTQCDDTGNCWWHTVTPPSCSGSYLYSQYCSGNYSYSYYSSCSGTHINGPTICTGTSQTKTYSGCTGLYPTSYSCKPVSATSFSYGVCSGTPNCCQPKNPNDLSQVVNCSEPTQYCRTDQCDWFCSDPHPVPPTLIPNPTPTAIPDPIANITSTPKPSSTPAPTVKPTSTPIPTTTKSITLNANLYNQNGTSLTTSSPWIGVASNTSSSYLALRFIGVTIPQGALITKATISLQSASNQWIQNSCTMYAENSSNSSVFSSTSLPSARPLTTAYVKHSENTSWAANSWYNLEDTTLIVQSVISRSDWKSGNNLSLIFKGSGSAWARKFISAAKITITFK